MALLRSIAIAIGVIVGGFLIIKLAGAYIDINGVESDLNNYSGDLLVECIGDPYCEDDIIEQMEMVRAHNGRDVVLLYETLDYIGSANKIILDGYKTVDLIVTKYTYNFSVEIDIWR